MLFEVEHTTRFDYSAPVRLDPLAIRLRPRVDRSQYLLHFEMKLDPAPAGLTEISDLDGNDTSLAWFSEEITSLDIRTELRAVTLRSNPFDYTVLETALLQLPMRYPPPESSALQPYLQPSGDPDVSALATDVMRTAEGGAPGFLTQLSMRLAADIAGEVRLEGSPLLPGDTLRKGAGSCRDAAVLFTDACRSIGLASRFVSGYQEGDPGVDEKYLHAWAEVYLSRVGWRGFDPTLGLAVADRHLAVAAGPSAHSAAPTSGAYRGTAQSEMKAHLDVRVRPNDDQPV